MWNAYCKEHRRIRDDCTFGVLYNRVLTHVLSPRFYAPDTPFWPMFFTVQATELVSVFSHYPNKSVFSYAGANKKAA